MQINDAMTLLIDELATDVPDPLAERLTLATIWSDLCQLTGEVPPPRVLWLVGRGEDDLPPAA